MNDIIFHIGKRLSFSKEIVKYIPAAVKRQLPKEIAIIAVSPKESLALNRRYRHKRKPANVLSFLYGPEYGEIIVCPPVIEKDAKRQGNPPVFQMTWMVLHGMLHLAGLHHERSEVLAKKVAKIEQDALSALARKK